MWDLQGLNEQGAVKILIKEIKQYKIDILAMQETHFKDKTIQEMDGLREESKGLRHYRTNSAT